MFNANVGCNVGVRAIFKLRALARVRIRIRLGLGFRSEFCKVCMRDFEIAQHVSQIAQIDKSCATPTLVF